jgi:hypothetical protein
LDQVFLIWFFIGNSLGFPFYEIGDSDGFLIWSLY